MRVSRGGIRREALCLFVCVLLTVLAHGVEAVEFNMLFMTKCISEEISRNTQVELEYRTYDKQDANRAVQTRVTVMPPHILDLPPQGCSDRRPSWHFFVRWIGRLWKRDIQGAVSRRLQSLL